jgi:hypothetical protein
MRQIVHFKLMRTTDVFQGIAFHIILFQNLDVIIGSPRLIQTKTNNAFNFFSSSYQQHSGIT